jgi:hypothetical protein
VFYADESFHSTQDNFNRFEESIGGKNQPLIEAYAPAIEEL